jgi:hypothetical protein
MLESELQKSILGDTNTTVTDIVGSSGKIENIYSDAGIDGYDQGGFNAGVEWLSAINSGLGTFDPSGAIDQDALRQLLYQARALLGELRIEEQAWNGEVNSEKTLRKDVNDFAKV